MSGAKVRELSERTGVQFFDYQLEALRMAAQQEAASGRLGLYFKTGAGKTFTALACAALWGQEHALVIAPPSTHTAWEEAARLFGLEIEAISHAKFRQKDYKVSRNTAVIADEFHLFGGQKGKGWKKIDRLAGSLQAPFILASATPNYNDAERVYCIQHALDPHSCKGGYIEFLYQQCTTEQNPFGREPIVTGFRFFPDAASYLAALPNVAYVPDDLVYTINDISIPVRTTDEFELMGYDQDSHKVMASIIEKSHVRINRSLINQQGYVFEDIYETLTDLAGQAATPLLVYANHATVAEALSRNLQTHGVDFGLVTGKTTKKNKDTIIDAFRQGALDALVGTASLATGTDGLDKVCDVLVILDDTQDDSLRRQLIGRIMPRGLGGDPTKKQVHRFVLDDAL